MLRTLRMQYTLLSPHERKRALQVFALMLTMAMVETLGIASILPFFTMLANPEAVQENAYLAEAYEILGFTDPQTFVLFLGTATLIIFVTALALKAATSYATVRFTIMRSHTIACRLLSAYLRQPYVFFLGRNTTELGKSVLTETGKVASGVMLPLLRMLAGAIVATAIVTLLLVVEPLLSLIAAGVLGGSFTVVYLFTRHFLRQIGIDRVAANQERFVIANEALSGIKELQLLGHVDSYLKRFIKPSERFARHQATSTLINELPQFGIQAVAFGGGLGALLYLTAQRGGLEEAIPLVSLYAFAGYRLLPAFQILFSNLARIRFSLPALEALYEDLMLRENQVAVSGRPADAIEQRLEGDIRLENVSFSYPNVDYPAIAEITLSVPRGSSAAFVGSTGAGKSTVVDVILGLLRPDEGGLLIGEECLDSENIRGWQRNIGYVPQSTYLADDTIAANIAFGVPAKEIDLAAVQRAATAAQIDEFVTQDLPEGYNTVVGERGIRLSGGQRQRIAIARALYHDPEVVVFDEATSALDNITEAVVMTAIEALRGSKTVIIIAHRTSTVERCDRIFVMKDGRLREAGTYEELFGSSVLFKDLVQGKHA